MHFREHAVIVSTKAVQFLSRLLHTDPILPDQPNQEWCHFSQSLSPARFVVWLANEVASDLMCCRRQCDIAALIVEVQCNRSGDLQNQAEQFLAAEFGGAYYRPDRQRAIIVFRRLLHHKLQTSKYE